MSKLHEWEEFGHTQVRRMTVPGGWLYEAGRTAMCFVPEPPRVVDTPVEVVHEGMTIMGTERVIPYQREGETLRDSLLRMADEVGVQAEDLGSPDLGNGEG